MVKKIIKRNNQKYKELFSKGNLYIRIIYRGRHHAQIRKLSHKYYEVLDFEKASLLGRRMISVPVVTKAKCKKSRITNTVHTYRMFSSIEDFNAESGLNYNLRDIKPLEL